MKKIIQRVSVWIIFAVTVIGTVLLSEQAMAGTLLYGMLFTPLPQSASFREMNFGEGGIKQAESFGEKHDISPGEVLSVWAVTGRLPLKDETLPYSYSRFLIHRGCLALFYPKEFAVLTAYMDGILTDLKCFPVGGAWTDSSMVWNFDNSWGGARTYGGDRAHEGTDIMSVENLPGALPVVSMTDGVVTSLGWLELGGWRVGVTAPSGVYYYYAHLDSYEDGLKEGMRVQAGQLLGYMGCSGYGPEGTTGQFPVHLHLGIYLPMDGKQVAVNPYWFLRALSD